MASSPSPSPPPLPLPPPPQSHSASPSLSPKQEPLRQPPPQETGTLSPPKKSPPFPWTDQETLALIQAYQEKWYSLKKGQLKAFQWEEVAVTVASRCGFDEPSKTATQCRHKIEKLRKRYRSELQKPYPNSWQYFELMDQMERGPMPLNARPIAAVKSSSVNIAHSNSNNSNSMNHGYRTITRSANYYHNHGDGGGSDESDEKWNSRHGRGGEAVAVTGNKSKSISNILRENIKSRVRSARTAAIERGFNGSGNRSVRMLTNPMNRKRKQYYVGNDSSDDDDDDYDEDNDDDSIDDVEEDERVNVGEEGIVGMELAGEIRGFAERFMRMENKKIEMMRETEMYRMEMEKKRIEMILEAQRKIIDTIGRAFGANKKAKMAQES